MPNDYRFDPFNNTKQPITITNEKLVIPSASPFTVRLLEVPLKEIPSSLTMRVVDSLTAAITTTSQTSITVAHGAWFAVGNVLTIDSEIMQVTAISSNTLTVARAYNSSTATTHTVGTDVFIQESMAEVASSPSAGQFWPDYSTSADSDPSWNTGTILFNNADAGKQVAVNYKGMGTLADKRFVEFNLPPHLLNYGDGSDGDFFSTGNVTLTWGEYQYKNFTLNAGHILNTSYPGVVIRVNGTCNILGTINGRGAGALSPGVPPAGTTSGLPGNPGSGGGGGGNSGSDSTNTGAAGGKSFYDGSFLVADSGAAPVTRMQKSLISLAGNKYLFGASGASAHLVGEGYTNIGGPGGGFILIVAKQIIFTGQIDVRGADGGNSQYGGGGGGGGGGVAILAASEWGVDTGTILTAGGLGGTGYQNGSPGGAGWYAKLRRG